MNTKVISVARVPSSLTSIARWRQCAATIACIAAVVAIWFLGRGIVFGTLVNYEQLTGHYEAHRFAWASPNVTLRLTPTMHAPLTVTGYASHDQRWTLDCGGTARVSVDIRAGYFRQLLPFSSSCGARGATIQSDWAMVPATGMGSRDTRALSWQILAVQSGSDTLPLDTLSSWSAGVYGVESAEFRSDPEGMLTEHWDASWYRGIAEGRYHYNGDPHVQQNVAWPFLFPWLVKAVAAVRHVPVSSAMVGLNAALSLAAMLLLFSVGRASGLTRSLSLVAPAWLIFNPFAYFLVGGFSEPLFLTLELLLVLLLLRKQYVPAAATVALLTATRFIGIIGVAWIAVALWCDSADSSISRRGKFLRVVLAGVMGLLGIAADIALKWAQTGYPFAAFAVRRSWRVTTFADLGGLLNPGALFFGDYLPVLVLLALLAGYALYVLGCTLRQAGARAQRLLLGAGISLVAATLVLNPEVNSAGRYFLPFAPAIAGLIGYAPLRSRSLSLILVVTAAGAAFMPFIVERIAMGQPPY